MCSSDLGPARGFRKGEPGGTLLGDQLQRRADQRFLQVAVMIATGTILPGPAHVKGLYMTPMRASRGVDASMRVAFDRTGHMES